ncbi:hypothetical protein CYMTET_24542, partial [Cymbomonas tetramitiformis]
MSQMDADVPEIFLDKMRPFQKPAGQRPHSANARTRSHSMGATNRAAFISNQAKPASVHSSQGTTPKATPRNALHAQTPRLHTSALRSEKSESSLLSPGSSSGGSLQSAQNKLTRPHSAHPRRSRIDEVLPYDIQGSREDARFIKSLGDQFHAGGIKMNNRLRDQCHRKDKSKSGKLSCSDMHDVLREFHLPVGKKELTRLLVSIDPDERDAIDYAKFLRYFDDFQPLGAVGVG